MAIKFQNSGGWVPVPGTAGTFATPTQQHERVTLTEAATVIPIGLALREGDFLTVLRENLPLVEGENYTKGDGSITLAKAGEPGDTFDFFIMHYEIAPTRGHVEERDDPHHTLSYITSGLSAGELLKYDGSKLVKAVKNVDYADIELLTWIPRFQVKGAQPAGMAYAKQEGWGVRVGKMVHLSCNITLSSKGTSPNDKILLVGLPYSVRSYTGAVCAVAENFDRAGTFRAEFVANYANLYRNSTSGAAEWMDFNMITDNMLIEGLSVTYQIK